MQKVNRDVKRNNNELHKSKVMRETRDFVQSNLKLDLIQPTNFEPVRLLIERLQLRSKGEI